MIRILTVVLTLVLLVPPAYAAHQTEITIIQAVQSALINAAQIRTAQANLQKAAAANLVAQTDPTILVADKLAAAHAEVLARMQLSSARLSTLQDVVEAYISLRAAQGTIELQTFQEQVDQKALEVAQVKLKLSNAVPLDVEKAQNALASSTQSLLNSKVQVKLAAVKLADFIGLTGDVRALAPGALPTLRNMRAQLRSSLADRLPSIVEAKQGVEQAELAVRLADNDFTPALTLKNAQIALANAQRALDTAQKSADAALASAYQAAQNAFEQLKFAQNAEGAALKSYDQDKARLRSGTISPNELQQAELTLKKTQFSRAEAYNGVLTALAALSAAAGQNLTAIGGIL